MLGPVAVLVLVALVGAPAASAGETSGAPPVLLEEAAALAGAQEETAVGTELPETQPRGAAGVSFQPNYVDLATRDFVRYRTGLKYGLTETLEARAELDVFSGNFARGDQGFGTSAAVVGAKYGLPIFAGLRSAVGADLRFPLGGAPLEVADGFTHLEPYAAASKTLELPRVELFGNAALDIVARTALRDRPAGDRPEHALVLTVGALHYLRHGLGYSGEVAYETTGLAGGDQNRVFAAPGVLWQVPPSVSHFLPGRWTLALSVRVPLTEEDENFRLLFKINADLEPFAKSVEERIEKRFRDDVEKGR